MLTPVHCDNDSGLAFCFVKKSFFLPAARPGPRSAVSSSPGPAPVSLLATVAHLHFNSKSLNVIGRKMVEKGRNIRHDTPGLSECFISQSHVNAGEEGL